jgi:hypothetical protein
MYAYNLLVNDGEGAWTQVRPGPEMRFPTLAALQAQVKADLGYLPGWLAECPPDEYIGVEDEIRVTSDAFPDAEPLWFVLDIEGSETAELAPLVQVIAYQHATNQTRSTPQSKARS